MRARRNLVQAQLFSEKLKHTLNAYHNRAIATQEVIEELIRLAKERDAANDSAVQAMEERDHRLDPPRQRAGPDSRAGEEDSHPLRLSPRSAGRGGEDGAGAGGAAQRGVGERVNASPAHAVLRER